MAITNSVTIIGVHRAFVKPAPSTTGITINGGKVTLDNIEVNGADGASTTGIALNSGTLVLRNSELTLLATGLTVNSTKADVIDSNITYNIVGVSTTGTGVDVAANAGVPPTGGPTEVRMARGNVIGNTTAFIMNAPGFSAGGPPFADPTILFWLDGSSNQPTTYLAGNGTLVTGTGFGCNLGGCLAGAGFSNMVQTAQQ